MAGSRLDVDLGVADIKPAGRCVFVIFGSTGDLTARKIAPALYNLKNDGLIDNDLVVLGLGRRALSDQQFRGKMQESIEKHSRNKPTQAEWDQFVSGWHYQVVHINALDEYRALAERLDELGRCPGLACGRIFYLAVAPDLVRQAVENLGKAGLHKPDRPDGFVRLVVEKPFGLDRSDAAELNSLIRRWFQEDQIYRIDHYLGKETVQNLLIFRFANAIFEPLLNRTYVDHVRITTAEAGGMEGRRGASYEQAGAMRDMMQNHMLQLLALVAMEVPCRLTSQCVRDEKAKLLRSVIPPEPQEVLGMSVRGQYGPGPDGKGAYVQEEGVAPDSRTETYAAVKLMVDNWRWSGVPFYLRTGKRLAAKVSQIDIIFRRQPGRMFQLAGCDVRGPNRLTFRIAPDEGIALAFDAKLPGPRMMLRPVRMDFRYSLSFESDSPEAYEHLLLDAIRGDPILFIRDDEVDAAWGIIDPIRTSWNVSGLPKLIIYAQGSWGPDEADGLFGDPYKSWGGLQDQKL